MKKLLAFVLFLNFSSFGQNLVPNGSFEDTIACPNALGQLWKTNFWINPTLGTPDLMHTCSVWPGISPIGYQQPHSGNAYSGIFLGSPTSNAREYIEVPLLDTLTSGQCYDVSFYANLGHLKYSTDAIHAYVSDTLIDSIPSSHVLNYNPQIRNQVGNFLDTLNWTFIQGEFEAVGDELFLIIGNFDSSSYCNWIIADSLNGTNNSYIYIDDVSVIPTVCVGLSENEEFYFKIYPNPVNETLHIISNVDKLIEVRMYNSLSNICIRKTFIRETDIELKNYLPGIYFYQLFNQNRAVKSGKFSKL